ncbi:hypothetical protein ACCT25_27915 [Rhizobium ruizarguesonis]
MIASTMWLSTFLRTRIADLARIAFVSGRWRREPQRYVRERAETQKRMIATGAVLSGVAALVATIAGALVVAMIFAAGAIVWVFSALMMKTAKPMVTSSAFLRFARFFRTNTISIRIYSALRGHIFPAIALFLSAVLILSLINKASFDIASAAGAFCEASPPEPKERVGTVSGQFDTGSLCFDTDMVLLKGERYRISLDIPEDQPWMDSRTASGAAGFTVHSLAHALGVTLRRWWAYDYFQPVARIGARGADEQPLYPIRPQADKPEHLTKADFLLVPKETGRLYIYLNDAVVGLPGLYDAFYRNNTGSATVAVENVSGY